MGIEDKLREAGFPLPNAPSPVGAYVPAVRTGSLAFTSGQLPLSDGKLVYAGKIGLDLSEEEGYAAARLCALNALAALKSLLGDLDMVSQVVKLTGFVNSTPEFTAQAKVLNGASELLGKLFTVGHARSAVSVASLPLGAAVELEMIVQI